MKKYIPSIFTSMNILCGFVALVLGDHYIGSILILTAAMFDALDGIAARAFNAQSAIGAELDSLADLVSFGIAPAYLYYLLSPVDHWIGLIPACILVASSALRLAIFNTKPSSPYFSGMPTPAVAMFLVGVFLAYHYENREVLALLEHPTVYFSVAALLSALMLSKIKMFSLKKINQGLAANKIQLVFLVITIILIFVNITLALALSMISYVLLSMIHSRFSDSYSDTYSDGYSDSKPM